MLVTNQTSQDYWFCPPHLPVEADPPRVPAVDHHIIRNDPPARKVSAARSSASGR